MKQLGAGNTGWCRCGAASSAAEGLKHLKAVDDDAELVLSRAFVWRGVGIGRAMQLLFA